MIKELSFLSDLESITGEGSQKIRKERIGSFKTEKMAYIYDVCFNPFITTKLSHLDFQHNVDGDIADPDDLWESFVGLVEDLKVAPAANDFLRTRANSLISNKLHEDDGKDVELRKNLMKILTKKMNIGVGAKLINQAYKREFIPDPSLMLADDKEEVISTWNEIFCEEKYDGVRMIALWDGNEFKYYTRAFKELDATLLSNITFSLKLAMINSPLEGEWFFDGELTDTNRKSVSGKVTKILKGTAPIDIGDDLVYHIFDLEETVTLKKGKGVLDYVTRRQTLESLLTPDTLEKTPSISLGNMTPVQTREEILEIYNRIVADGGEGVICKNNHLYECKRSKSWIKIKEVNDCDLYIRGWYPGEGKREGYIGGFICEDSSGTVKVKVGSGFTDNDLETFSKDPDSYKGMVAAVQYNVPITDKYGERSLFLPRLIEVRSDKDLADDLSVLF